jgi:hypothetical protein
MVRGAIPAQKGVAKKGEDVKDKKTIGLFGDEPDAAPPPSARGEGARRREAARMINAPQGAVKSTADVRRETRGEQSRQLRRVERGIGAHILDFFAERGAGREFFMQELTRFVTERVEGYVAPGSPDRVMRELRKQGQLSYELLSRSKSLYRVGAGTSAESQP